MIPTVDNNHSVGFQALSSSDYEQVDCCACCLIHATFLPLLHFNPEDGDHIFLLNSG
jgi:hypothetical protein